MRLQTFCRKRMYRQICNYMVSIAHEHFRELHSLPPSEFHNIISKSIVAENVVQFIRGIPSFNDATRCLVSIA